MGILGYSMVYYTELFKDNQEYKVVYRGIPKNTRVFKCIQLYSVVYNCKQG